SPRAAPADRAARAGARTRRRQPCPCRRAGGPAWSRGDRLEAALELCARRKAGDDAVVLDHVSAGGAAPPDRLELGATLGERDRYDHDPVSAGGLDQDRADHRRQPDAEDSNRADALLGPEPDRGGADLVVADRGQQAHLGPEPRRADRLVRALAAVVGSEPV